MARSSWATTYQDGMVFQAGCCTDEPNAVALIGFCVAAMTLASMDDTSRANTSRNCARSMYRNPAASGRSAAPSGDGYFSPYAAIGSPASGAKAARYTSAVTFALPAAAPLITAPPYE